MINLCGVSAAGSEDLKMEYRTIVSCCLILMVMVLLSGSALADGEASHPYYPLDDGFKWSGNMRFPLLNAFSASRVSSRVDGKTDLNGKEYWNLIQVVSGYSGTESTRQLVRVDSAGVYVVDTKNVKHGEYLSLPIPLNLGSAWVMKMAKGDVSCLVESAEDVYLTEKDFKDCLQVKCEGKVKLEKRKKWNLSTFTHYCAGIGVVKEDGSYRETGVKLMGKAAVEWNYVLEDSPSDQ